MLNRRSFLTRSTLAAGAGAPVAAPRIARSAEQILATPGQKPKKIIHIVSDGMSVGTLTCSDLYSKLIREKTLTWTRLMHEPTTRVTLMNTRSLNSMVTDSSAASSAWGSGSRVVNGAVNVLPDGTLLTPLYKLFADAGWKTGLVTTAEITHATPAGFATAVRSRGDSQAIALQYLDRKVDVLLGGGRPFFSAASRKDKRDLKVEFRSAGYAIALNRDELMAAPTDTRLFGVFASGHLPYTIDHRSDPALIASTPTLAEMTTAALDRLGRSENFILQVEGARIDHAAHNSDAPAAIHDQIALDEAIDVVLAYQKQNPDTLVVITTDHANSNLGLNGMGGGYRTSSQQFATVRDVKMSYPEIVKRLEKAGEKIKVAKYPDDPEDRMNIPDPMAKVDPNGKVEGDKAADDKTKFTAAVQADAVRVDPAKIIDILAETTGYRMSRRRAELFARSLAGDLPQLYDQMNPVVTQLGQLMANRIGIGWTGNTHTADYVQLLALGPGSERFSGLVENTDIFTHYTALAGIDFKNVTAPLIAHSGPEAQEVEHSHRYASAWA